MEALLSAMPEWPLIIKLAILTLPMIPNLWGIWHAYRHSFENQTTRVIWMCICVFLPVIGGVAYLLMGRPKAMPPVK